MEFFRVMQMELAAAVPMGLLAAGALVFGCCLGSFLNVCIWRIPLGESVVFVPSHCPKCNHPIRWFDNVPVLAWLALGGKCRDCKAPISPRYILMELLVGGLYLALALAGYFSGAPIHVLILYTIVLSVAIPCIFIDAEFRRLPDRLTIFGIVSGILYCWMFPANALTRPDSLLHSLVSAFGGMAAMWIFAYITSKIFRRKTLGAGDIKYTGFLGAALGAMGMIFTVAAGCVLAVVSYMIINLLRRNKAADGYVAFGIYLGIAAIIWCGIKFIWPVNITY